MFPSFTKVTNYVEAKNLTTELRRMKEEEKAQSHRIAEESSAGKKMSSCEIVQISFDGRRPSDHDSL